MNKYNFKCGWDYYCSNSTQVSNLQIETPTLELWTFVEILFGRWTLFRQIFGHQRYYYTFLVIFVGETLWKLSTLTQIIQVDIAFHLSLKLTAHFK